MDVLPVNFKILKYCGMWDDNENSSSVLWCLSKLYRNIIVTLMFLFTILELLALAAFHEDVENVVEILFVALSYIGLCAKVVNFLFRQNELSLLLNSFRAEICQPRDFTEKLILRKYNRQVKFCTLFFLFVSQSAGVAMSLGPVIEQFHEARSLPFTMYVPYSLENKIVYYCTYFLQIVSGSYGIIINVSLDSLVFGFTILVCGQIELLCRRIKENRHVQKKGKIESIEYFVEHHVHIKKLVKRIQAFFIWTITMLFFFSLIILCMSTFHLSKRKFPSMEFLSTILYFGCMLIQIFFYCWHGNELEIKSREIADAIYASDWVTFTTIKRKSLLYVMFFSSKGIKISYHGIFGLDIPTFTTIVKTSYSAFSVLQNVSD